MSGRRLPTYRHIVRCWVTGCDFRVEDSARAVVDAAWKKHTRDTGHTAYSDVSTTIPETP